MVVFLGESSSEGLLDALNQYGTGTAEENAKMPRGWFNCGSWVVFWVLTAVTVSLTAIGAMVEAEEKRTVTFILCDTSKSFLSVTGLYFVSLG